MDSSCPATSAAGQSSPKKQGPQSTIAFASGDGAARKAKTFTQYLKLRICCLLHHFCGVGAYGVGEALKKAAGPRGMAVTHMSVDKKRDGSDLMLNEPYDDHMRMAAEHRFDAYQAGPMCSSFSAVRFREGGPPPVRDGYNLYGLPENSPAQQREADK